MEILIVAFLWIGGSILVGFLFKKHLPDYSAFGMGFASLVFNPLTGLLAFVIFLSWDKLFNKSER